MSTAWKMAIVDFLNKGDQDNLQNQLLKNWVDIFPEEKLQIYNFLFHSSQHPLFFSLLVIDLKNRAKDLPWLLTAHLLQNNQQKMPEELFIEFQKKLIKQKLINDLSSDQKNFIQQLNTKRTYQFKQRLSKTKQELMASALIAESEQLVDQHVHYLNELKKISPQDFGVSNLLWNRQKKTAERILNRRRQPQDMEKNGGQELDDTQRSLLKKLKQQAMALVAKGSRLPSDFGYMFRSLGDTQSAVDFIYKNENIEQKDWQLLDFLFHGEQHLSLLDHCNYLKSKYSAQPDFLFSVSYVEAIAYWKLGEKAKALDLMEQIASMRPDYKSASETLSRWKEDYLE